MLVAYLIWFAVLLGSLLGVYTKLPLYGLPLQAAALVAAAIVAGRCPLPLRTAPLRLTAIAVVAFLALAAVGSFVSVSPDDSLLQLSQWASYAAVAYVGAAVVRRTQPRLAAEFLLLVGLLMCGIALYFYWGELGNLPRAVMLGSFGNKNHLAGLLLLLLPLALALFVAGDRGRERWGYGGCCLLMGATFVLAYSRGAYVALVPGVALVGLWAWQSKTRLGERRRLRIAIGRGLLLALLVVVQVSLMRGASLGYALGRSADALTATAGAVTGGDTGDTLAPRISYWTGALRIWADHPLLGAGPGTFYLVLPEYQEDPRFFSMFAHNLPLQVGAEMGLLGLLAAAAAAAGVIWGAWRVFRATPATSLAAGLAAALLAGAVHNLVEMDWYIPALGNVAAAEAGLLLGMGMTAFQGESATPVARRQWLLSGVAMVLALGTLAQWGSEVMLKRGDEVRQGGDAIAAEATYRFGQQLNLLNGALALALGDLYLGAVEAGADGRALETGLGYARQAVALSPHNVAYRSLLARLYLREPDGAGLRQAVGELDAIVALRRSYLVPYAYLQLGNAYLALGEVEAAERTFRGLLDGFPDGPDSPQPDSQALPRDEVARLLAEAQLALGMIAIGRGDGTAAVAAFTAAAELRPEAPEAYFHLGALATGRPQSAVAYLEQAAALAPGDAVGHIYLGLAYAEVGRCQDSKQSLERAAVLDPTRQVGLTRLNELCGGY